MEATQVRRAVMLACGPDLIHKRYRDARPADAHRTWGCCYVACEALYHLYGKRHGYRLHYISFGNGNAHFYLMNAKGHVLDPTRRQFYGSGIRLEYRKGTCCGFMTVKPSKRCELLMARIRTASC